MNLVTVSGGLLFLAALVPLAPRQPAVAGPAPLSVAVTRAGEVMSASLPSERTLRISTEREGAAVHYDLELTALPEGARVVSVKLGAFVDKGLAALLAVESGTDVEYRYLFTNGDPLRGELLAGSPAAWGGKGGEPWSLSDPLFTSTGAPYRLVDICNTGGDSLEMTFRRGALKGSWGDRSEDKLGVDERIIHDTCPMSGKLIAGRSVSALVESVVRSP